MKPTLLVGGGLRFGSRPARRVELAAPVNQPESLNEIRIYSGPAEPVEQVDLLPEPVTLHGVLLRRREGGPFPDGTILVADEESGREYYVPAARYADSPAPG